MVVFPALSRPVCLKFIGVRKKVKGYPTKESADPCLQKVSQIFSQKRIPSEQSQSKTLSLKNKQFRVIQIPFALSLGLYFSRHCAKCKNSRGKFVHFSSKASASMAKIAKSFTSSRWHLKATSPLAAHVIFASHYIRTHF